MRYQIPQRGVKNVRPRQENKRLDETSTGKDLTLFNLLYQPYTNKPYDKNNSGRCMLTNKSNGLFKKI